jgi:hypothetical protein
MRRFSLRVSFILNTFTVISAFLKHVTSDQAEYISTKCTSNTVIIS